MKMRRTPRARASAHACCGLHGGAKSRARSAHAHPAQAPKGRVPCTSEARKDVGSDVIASHLRQSADGPAHGLIGHLNEAVRQFIGRQSRQPFGYCRAERKCRQR